MGGEKVVGRGKTRVSSQLSVKIDYMGRGKGGKRLGRPSKPNGMSKKKGKRV